MLHKRKFLFRFFKDLFFFFSTFATGFFPCVQLSEARGQTTRALTDEKSRRRARWLLRAAGEREQR